MIMTSQSKTTPEQEQNLIISNTPLKGHFSEQSPQKAGISQVVIESFDDF